MTTGTNVIHVTQWNQKGLDTTILCVDEGKRRQSAGNPGRGVVGGIALADESGRLYSAKMPSRASIPWPISGSMNFPQASNRINRSVMLLDRACRKQSG